MRRRRVKRVVLFSLVPETRFGGSAVYAAHLYRAFEEQGFKPLLVRIGKKTESRARPFTHDVSYHNMSVVDALGLSRSFPSLITYTHWKTHATACEALLSANVPVVMHDVAEYGSGLFTVLKRTGNRIVAIRRYSARKLSEAGMPATFIPHPYVRLREPLVDRRYGNPLCIGRVEFRKHQEIVIAANMALEEAQRIHMYGALDRVFAHHILDKRFNAWRQYYHGPFSTEFGNSVSMLREASYAVDLTVIKKGDGDGSQYLFLEAWEAGVPLVVHKEWIRTGKDEVRDGETAIAISTPDELAEVMRTPVRKWDAVVQGGYAQLAVHDSSSVIPQYMDTMGVQR